MIEFTSPVAAGGARSLGQCRRPPANPTAGTFVVTQGDSTAAHHRQPAPSANPKTPEATAAKATPTPTQNLAQAIRPTPKALPVLRILRSPRRSHCQPHHAGQRGTRTGARTIELPRRLPQLQRQPRRNRHDDERRAVHDRIEATQGTRSTVLHRPDQGDAPSGRQVTRRGSQGFALHKPAA
jgi:hypothetical protein